MDDMDNSEITAASGMLRLGWMFYGNLVLVACAILIATTRGDSSAIDTIFWATVAGCIALRYLDITRMNSRTVINQPAALRHWRRYALFLSVAAAVVWGVAHGVYWLSR
jgi:hypothetical protein